MVGQPSEINSALSDSANINTMWASLIIEECIRLGLTYFCIAPGSRSSPLTIAATAHTLASCISCFDERSLAFHAVGYARGSHKPAVVITSSGTAVSNLLPAVVEASQDFVPLLLLTADRPPELQDAGANQAINQVNHFGSFVRFFFSLPPPTDHIPARMVLTTIDSAVYSATHAPHGPVHINCPFREPLEDISREWMLSCLNGLDSWMSRTEPFTKYIRMECRNACKSIQVQMAEILKVIQSANQGLLVIGAIHTEDEIWATLLLAKHLFWPVVPDILSGIRLRKLLTFFPAIEENFIFIDHLDHALVSDLVRVWARPDVIVQVGSRITSKRIAHLLEFCSPSSYIMVEKHPYRHDPSHIITHRIQSTITEFANCLLKANFPRMARKWSVFLKALDITVSRELSFHIHAEYALTEPYVAQVISESFPGDTALFIGNSMAIRDMDMYGHGWVRPTNGIESTPQSFELLCHGIQATGNRGASGIDGLLSTAVGFAVGCNKRVVCVVGDVSFLHDTNGLAILNQRKWRKPMTIIVINNYGGAIFSLLPIADRTQPSILNQYFYTSHDVSIRELCVAHGVKHLRVRTKVELQEALYISQHAQTDIVIEVESNIEANAAFHRRLRKSACQAADHAMNILSALSIRDPVSNGFFLCRIHKMELSFYRIQLSAPPTSAPSSNDLARSHREGFILTLFLEDGNVGFGEVSPLEIHKENMEDVEEQLRFLVHAIQGARISFFVPLAEGSFSSWIWCQLGIRPTSIFPSVLCGLEMAILNALAARQGSTLSDILLANDSAASDPQLLREKERSKMPSKVHICALLDSNGSAEEVAHAAARMAEEGFTTLKLKVARQANPIEDAAIVHEIRRKIGHHVKIRVDANRNWTYEQAIQFGYLVKGCNLEYIEEPVNYADDIIKFCEETGLPVALDESIDNIQGNPLKGLSKFIHSGIVAVVIKPSVVGGFEKAALIAKWAQMQDKLAIVSSAFESSLSLAAYIQFSHYLEKQNRELCILRNKGFTPPIAHGLGTYRWLEEDVSIESVRICLHPFNGTVEASVEDAAQLLKNFKLNQKVIQRSYSNEQVQTYQWAVDCKDFSCSLKVREAGLGKNNNVLLFLHGFLGTGEDWIPIMKAISGSARCISVDLPGHGGSQMHRQVNQRETQELCMSMEVIADILNKLIHDITPGKVVLVGYSMGARIALYMALRRTDKVDGAVLVSGSPGLKDAAARSARTDQDDSRARLLTTLGLQSFLDTWYAGEFWKSLRGHSHFKQITSNRLQHGDISALAKVLSDLSIGRQLSLWEDLKQCRKQLLLVVGEKDQKFKEIARQMIKEMGDSSKGDGRDGVYHELIEIPECGHAVHLENPLPLINAMRKFLTKLNRRIVQ